MNKNIIKYPMSNQFKYEHFLKCFLAITIYLIFISLTFGPLPSLGFSIPDDHWMLLKNDFVHPKSFTWDYILDVMKRINGIQYSPLNTFYYYLIYKLNGYDPYYFHLFNLLIHITNSLLIFIVSKKVIYFFTNVNDLFISYLICLFWVVHPLQIEVVAWVSGSKILLCSFFTLISFAYFIKGLENDKMICYLISLLFFLLSFFCKEQAILTPYMFSIFFYYKIKYKSKFKNFNFKKSSFILIIMLTLSILFAMFTLYVNQFGNTNYLPAAHYSLLERINLTFYCLRFYIANQIAPMNLHYNYPFPFASGNYIPFIFMLYTLLFIPFIILVFNLLKRTEFVFFHMTCIILFLIQISIELQIIPMTRPAIVADRYMYLPSFFLILFLFHILKQLVKNNFKYKCLTLVFGLFYLLYFSLYSHHLLQNWLDLNLIK